METIALSTRLKYDPKTRTIITDHATPIARDPDIAAALPMAEKISRAQSLIEQAMATVKECQQSLPLIITIIDENINPVIAERIRSSNARREKAKEKSAKRLDSRQTENDADTNAPAGRIINVIHNTQKSGIEIQYDAKPSAKDIATLKDKGFRYSIRQKIWYCPYSHDTWAWAQCAGGSCDVTTILPPAKETQPTTPVPDPTPSTSTLPTIDIAALLGRK